MAGTCKSWKHDLLRVDEAGRAGNVWRGRKVLAQQRTFNLDCTIVLYLVGNCVFRMETKNCCCLYHF